MGTKKIVVLATGGTIAGRAGSPEDNIGYMPAKIEIGELLSRLMTSEDCVTVSEQVAQIDSKDMSFEVWRELADRCAHWLSRDDVRGIIVTHGTDTMEETAYFLHMVLAPVKPVVLTGAMRPATSVSADGPQNILDAVTVACAEGARGVVVAFAGVVHGALDVIKVHSWRQDAFDSGDAGPLGYVENGELRLVRTWPQSQPLPFPSDRDWPRVEIVMNYAGATGATVRALMDQGVEGLVAAGTGNGSLHRELEAALLEAQSSGVRVVRTSRCARGRVLGKASDPLAAAEGLSPVKARIALMLEMMA